MIPEPDRLERTLGERGLQWVIGRIRRRLESGLPLQTKMALRFPTQQQRQALARLLGKPTTRSGAISVSLAELDALVRHAGLGSGLVEAVEALSGPIVNHRREQAEIAESWRILFEEAVHLSDKRSPVVEWLVELERSRLLARLTKGDVDYGRGLLGHAVDIACRLPLSGTPIAELAATVTGDSHALDTGMPLSAILLRLISRLSGIEEWATPEGRRSAWASVGVIVDELSAPVLVLNLKASGDSELDRAANLHAQIGEPYRISTRQLLRRRLRFTAAVLGGTVYVCENPPVVAAAAERLGKFCAPLICIEGQPKTAAHVLILQLREAGIDIAYHGDFDWPGLGIGNVMVRRYGSTPWRFGTADYQEAPKGKGLRGQSIKASWDAALSIAMTESGKSVHEEAVLPTLLKDLERSATKEKAT